jgi:NADPH:quinone reductase-like Zn-dependent oxidoreductase
LICFIIKVKKVTMQNMKAVVCPEYGSPEVLSIEEVSKPSPKAGEILIKIKACSVSVADRRLRAFDVPAQVWIPARLALGLRKPKKPILGVEISGIVEELGENCSRFKPGDEVFSANLTHFGGYAEYVCLPEDGPISLKPSNLTFTEAAAVPTGARTALHFLKKGQIEKGQKILIYGASGSVGTYAVQLAKRFGAEVTAICSGKNIPMVRAIGADKAVDYKQENFTQDLGQYDILFMAVDKWPFSEAINFLKDGGYYVNITQPIPSIRMMLTSAFGKKKLVLGENVSPGPDGLILIKELIEKGKIRPVIDRVYQLEEIVVAHRYVDMGHKAGNVVIEI